MLYAPGDSVQVNLTLLSVDGEEIPVGSGEQSIKRSVKLGLLHKEAIDNFISSEVLSFSEITEAKNYHLDGDLFFPAYRKDLICKIPRTNVDKDIKEGELIQNKQGNVGYVSDTKPEEYILVDFNHPFAGKMIEFNFEVLGSVSKSCS